MTIPDLPTLQCPTDSLEYEILWNAACQSLELNLMDDRPVVSLEFGVRRGGSSELIMMARKLCDIRRVHIGIDPWGNLPYAEGDNFVHHDYDDKMRRTCLGDIYAVADHFDLDAVFLPIRDTDFFEHFPNGIPYAMNGQMVQLKTFGLVHFDGPHSIPDIITEIEYVDAKSPIGRWWVFDDVGLYDHHQIDDVLRTLGFERRDNPLEPDRKDPRKASYCRVK